MGGGGGSGGLLSGLNIFNSNVGNNRTRGILNTLDPGGGLGNTAQAIVPADSQISAGIATPAAIAAKKKEDEINAANAKAISDAKAAKDLAASQAAASITNKKRAIARSRSVYTSPLGSADQASTARKTLLGE
jgi:hypothetical protein